MVDIRVLLRKLESFEGKLAELYQGYSERFSDDTEIATLFQKLSREEQSHQRLIEFQLRMVFRDQKAFKNVEVKLEEVEACLDQINEALLGKPSITEALNLAMELETSATEMHYRTAMELSNPELSRLLNSLNQGDKAHLNHLKNYVEDILPHRNFP